MMVKDKQLRMRVQLQGLMRLRIINEPTAAAAAYGLNNKERNKRSYF